MKQVYCIFSQRSLNIFLKKIPRSFKIQYIDYHLSFPSHEHQKLRLLKISPVTASQNHNSARDSFLSKYINLISQISEKNSNLKWFCSNIACRNKSISRIPDLIHELQQTLLMINQSSSETIIIWKPSWEILDSLKMSIKQGVSLHYSKIAYLIHNIQRLKNNMRWLSSMFHRMIITICKKTYATIYLKKRLLVYIKQSHQKPIYIIKSFITDNSLSYDNLYHDPYFGKLAEYLKSQFKILHYVKINNHYFRTIRRIFSNKEQIIFPVEIFLPFLDIVKALGHLLLPKNIKGRYFFDEIDITDLIRNEVARTYNGYIPYEQYLFFFATQKLTKYLLIHTFLMTYEMMPWERMCTQAIKTSSPKTRILAYQHSGISQATAGIFPTREEVKALCTPDVVITTGIEVKNIISTYSSFFEEQLKPSCALRFQDLFKNHELLPKTNSRSLLILLQDMPQIELMLKYLLHQNLHQHGYRVRLRPNTGFLSSSVQSKLLKKYNNSFEISSHNTLKDDYLNCDIVMYWETSAALEALWHGKPVIHFDLNHVLSYDPLFRCSYLKWTIQSHENLLDLIEKIYQIDHQEFQHKQLEARRYISNYFMKPSDQAMKVFL